MQSHLTRIQRIGTTATLKPIDNSIEECSIKAKVQVYYHALYNRRCKPRVSIGY